MTLTGILGLCQGGVTVAAPLQLARPFGSHMVLPMERSVPVWGVAEPGKTVEVKFGVQAKSAKTATDGTWRIMLERMPASSQGQRLQVQCAEEQVILDDILVGRVWLCSGQSNMDFTLAKSTSSKLVAEANNPQIRLLNWTGVSTDNREYGPADMARLQPDKFFAGTWQTCSPQSAGPFSAVAYLAGVQLQEELKIPIGLVENAVGGSSAEAWLPKEVLELRSEYAPLRDSRWLEFEKTGGWARGRALKNLSSWVREGKPEPTPNHPFRPAFLFESGVRPWAGFPFDGVLWYQGESNAELHDDAWNERLITDLVHGWRKVLAQPDLPFVMVQLPNIGGKDPLRQYWPEFRKVQEKAAKSLKNTDLVITKDLGWESPDVHPPQKEPVAKRVAEAVLKRVKK